MILQLETRVRRTYRGGRCIDEFLGKAEPADCFAPEDWISSFTEAKNRNPIPGEGITRVRTEKGVRLITEAVPVSAFGEGRTESGVLIKLLDSAERLGIQVHPTPEFSRAHFGTDYGKTECWHILGTRPEADGAVYIGFREGITREKWKALYEAQDIAGMLSCLHRFPVKAGDTVLVRAGTPHAIGAGCFLLEIQEPSDYTMRVERVTPAGEHLTPQQIHYGAGEEAMLDCFAYEGLPREEARRKFFLPPRPTAETGLTDLVTYSDTPCFALRRTAGECRLSRHSFCTLVMLQDGTVRTDEGELTVRRGDKIFVPAGDGAVRITGEAIVCLPPRAGV